MTHFLWLNTAPVINGFVIGIIILMILVLYVMPIFVIWLSAKKTYDAKTAKRIIARAFKIAFSKKKRNEALRASTLYLNERAETLIKQMQKYDFGYLREKRQLTDTEIKKFSMYLDILKTTKTDLVSNEFTKRIAHSDYHLLNILTDYANTDFNLYPAEVCLAVFPNILTGANNYINDDVLYNAYVLDMKRRQKKQSIEPKKDK